MARAYISFGALDPEPTGINVTASCYVVGVEPFEGIGVTLLLPGEPSAATIISTLRGYLLAEVEVATGVALSPGQTVLFNAPV